MTEHGDLPGDVKASDETVEEPDARALSIETAMASRAAGSTAALMAEWHDRLPTAYRTVVSADDTAGDLEALASLVRTGDDLSLRFTPDTSSGSDSLELDRAVLRACSLSGDVQLSKFMPILESLGLWVYDESHWVLDAAHGHVFVFRLAAAPGTTVDLLANGDRIAEAAIALWQGLAEVDNLNQLVAGAALDWREVDLLRAFVHYRRQIDVRYSAFYVSKALVEHPGIAGGLVDFFHARFDPEADGQSDQRIFDDLISACDAIDRLDHDRILRGLLGTMDATLRTNRFFRPEGPLALKLDSARVPDVVHPIPFREIWVHGSDVRGIHLRGGPISRGGIRWSDRAQDLRMEVLDLMRTQILKNALIVPTGAKGGFILVGRSAALTGDDQRTAVRDAYAAFISALLDITDNRVDDVVVPVPGRRDGDDPYLVVAADKGTAAFSDLANEIAIERNFWLGDAFASGGADGYDHKELGVTAKGAWTAVSHHFDELGVDVSTERITVAGIGDMSGDVFGNGMLRSECIALVAAFDHRDIFLDPDPDLGASFAERQRLFDLPRSSWQDYDPLLISDGGGVYSRSLKSIELTPQVQAALRTDADELTPNELIQAILRAPVDLLYAGGIGTFVRASSEDDRTIDDRANSETRVEGSTLRARVVGEGANLAFTQRARIEYARRGGRINMDAIDNSGGVDSSDEEVNLKIFLDMAVNDGRIDRSERNRLLHDNTDKLVARVIDHVARQCERLTISAASSPLHPGWFERVLRDLVDRRVLDPEVEALPDDAELEARRAAGAGLTRPELAVIMAGTKRWLTAQLLDSPLPDDPVAQAPLASAFPDELAAKFPDLLEKHPLRRELAATAATNDIVDRIGITYVHRVAHDTGAEPWEVVAATGVARGVTGSQAMWETLIRPSAGPTTDPTALDPRRLIIDLIESLVRWELAKRDTDGIDVLKRISEDEPVFRALLEALPNRGTTAQRAERSRLQEQLVAAGVTKRDAAWASLLPDLRVTPDVALLSRQLKRDPVSVLDAILTLDDRLGLDRLATVIRNLDFEGRWEQAAQKGLLEDLAGITRHGVRQALAAEDDTTSRDAVHAFLDARSDEVAEAIRFCRDAESDPEAGLDGLTVAVRSVRRALSA